jgi:hypothetical protein
MRDVGNPWGGTSLETSAETIIWVFTVDHICFKLSVLCDDVFVDRAHFVKRGRIVARLVAMMNTPCSVRHRRSPNVVYPTISELLLSNYR